MKVLTLRLQSVFSRLDILSETFSWNLSDVQIYNKVLSFVCRTFSLPFHKLYRTLAGTFSRDITHQLAHYPRKIRKILLQKLNVVFNAILLYPQYFEDIVDNSSLHSSPFSSSSSGSSSTSSSFCSINYLTYNLYVRYVSDSQTIVKKYGNISDHTILTILVRKSFLSKIRKVVSR